MKQVLVPIACRRCAWTVQSLAFRQASQVFGIGGGSAPIRLQCQWHSAPLGSGLAVPIAASLAEFTDKLIIGVRPRNVCFTPKSGHGSARS